MNKWKRKIASLILLAEDQAGKPEGDLAREKLRLILDKHPEARQYAPVRRFMTSDLARMKQAGISTDGSWTGHNLAEALALMTADYARRLRKQTPTLLLPRLDKNGEMVYNGGE